VPKPYPREFREDVIRVARSREPGVRIKDIAAAFGISESCLQNWLTQAERDDGIRSGRDTGRSAGARQGREPRRVGVPAGGWPVVCDMVGVGREAAPQGDREDAAGGDRAPGEASGAGGLGAWRTADGREPGGPVAAQRASSSGAALVVGEVAGSGAQDQGDVGRATGRRPRLPDGNRVAGEAGSHARPAHGAAPPPDAGPGGGQGGETGRLGRKPGACCEAATGHRTAGRGARPGPDPGAARGRARPRARRGG
jgi:hypothetical protein